MFKDNKYQVIRNAISYDLSNFIFNYQLLRRDAVAYMYQNEIIIDNGHYGTWKDKQVPNVYSEYADNVMETLLMKMLPIIQKETKLELIPTYSYTRVYERGCTLKKHKDRPSCEISTTLCLGYNVDNVDSKKFPDYNWPMWVQGKKGNELPVGLNPGDMIVYRGHDIDHWREPFIGLNHSQVFLHYNDKNGPFNTVWDGRPLLGIPRGFQTRRTR